MNLMFWKKKPGNGNGAEDARGDSSMNKKERESLDFATAKQQSSESNPESPNPEPPEQDAPVETGLVARIKSKFTSFTQHFRKAPVFRAGEDYASNDHDNLNPAPDDTAAPKPDSKPADPETPANPGLVERIKSNAFISQHKKPLIFTLLPLSLIVIVYAAWNIIFPPPVSKPALHSTDEALIHEPPPPIKSSPAASPQSEQTQAEAGALKKKSEETQARAEAPKKEPSEQAEAEMLKKKTEGVQTRAESPKKEGSEQTQAKAEVLKETSKDAQARAEVLKKKSEEAQAQAEALKKESEAVQAKADELKKREEEKARIEALKNLSPQTGGGAAPSYSSGEMTVGNSDPKATARSLKEAIEAMNAASGEPPRDLPNKRSPAKSTKP